MVTEKKLQVKYLLACLRQTQSATLNQFVTELVPKTDKVMDTDGHEIEFTPNAPEQDAS